MKKPISNILMKYKHTLLAFLLTISANVIISTNTWAQWHTFESTAFTTDVEIVFWHESTITAKKLNQSILEEFERIDQRFSRYISTSEVSRINQLNAGQSLKISEELFLLLEQAQKVAELSQGAFDITFASQGYLYNFRAKEQPTPKQLQDASQINYTQLQLVKQSTSIRHKRTGIIIDLGGIAKGYAIDQAIRILKEAHIEHARVSAGGDMRLLGDKKGKPWIVAIKDPRSDEKQAVTLPLSDTALSTSGDYERFFIDANGNRIHHILTPQTGKPAKGIQSVSILATDATTSDALSTAVFVTGVESGLELINGLPGIEAIIIDAERKMHYSDGLMAPE